MEKPKDPAAVAMAKKRAESLSPERRREIAQNAIATRWAQPRKKALKKVAKKNSRKRDAAKP